MHLDQAGHEVLSCAVEYEGAAWNIDLVGPADRIKDRLGAWRDAGKRRWVDTMNIVTPQKEALELLAEELL